MKRTEVKKGLNAKSAAELETELSALLKEQFGLRMHFFIDSRNAQQDFGGDFEQCLWQAL